MWYLLSLHFTQRERLFLEAKFRQLKFRNEFILGMSSSNAVVQKYFSTDILDIIEVCSYRHTNNI